MRLPISAEPSSLRSISESDLRKEGEEFVLTGEFPGIQQIADCGSLHGGDRIHKIGGTHVKAMSVTEVVAKLQGLQNDDKIQIKRPNVFFGSFHWDSSERGFSLVSFRSFFNPEISSQTSVSSMVEAMRWIERKQLGSAGCIQSRIQSQPHYRLAHTATRISDASCTVPGQQPTRRLPDASRVPTTNIQLNCTTFSTPVFRMPHA